MAMNDFGWIDLCYGGRPQQPCCSLRLQAIVSELDSLIKDVEDLRDRISEVEKPDAEGLVRAAVEKHLSEYLRRCNELNQKWQVQITNFGEELKRLKAEEIVELRTSLASQAAQLSSLDSDMQVLRQLLPVHGASLKATEAALQLLREGTERSEALEALRADLSALKKSCRQSNVALLQLREALPEAVAFSQDVTTLRRDAEQQAAKVAALGRSLSTVEEQQNLKGRELDRLRSEVGMIKTASQARTKEVQEFAEIRGEVQRLRTEVDYIKGTKLRALQSSEKAAAGMADLSRSIEALQSRLKGSLEQIKGGAFMSRWPGEGPTQLSVGVPVSSSRLATPRTSRKLLQQPSSPLTAGRVGKRGSLHTQLLHIHTGDEEPIASAAPEQAVQQQQLSGTTAAVAAAALSATKSSHEFGISGSQQAPQSPQGTASADLQQQQPEQQQQQQGLFPPTARTPSTPPAFTRPTLQGPHLRGLATRRHSSAGVPLQQQEDTQEQEQQQRQQQLMDLSQKRRVNFGHHVAQQHQIQQQQLEQKLQQQLQQQLHQQLQHPQLEQHVQQQQKGAEEMQALIKEDLQVRNPISSSCSSSTTDSSGGPICGNSPVSGLQFSEPHPEVEDLHDFALDKATDTQQGPAATVETPDACATVEMQQQSAEARVSPPADDPVKPLV
ncbi:mediator of RNA polymerase II transcription subunit 15 [Cyclospora cayetanensis]|uniref:Mediator of RNA polymerase II transcription subunit 15 n=1 Tax=Cyclospora cayetanensis TaxID=88456 RepID=A0A6P6RQP2_9EIME|nr:mediator of RNA polymerase II transcription subunit 15 [Cyclospora cayetanensis]